MKLRNKKTGVIGDLQYTPDKEYHFMIETEDPADIRIYKTLAELNEEWEDYEEPKEYWFISDRGEIFHTEDNMSIDEKRKFFGNYFDTREEAEKAVKKLKAWKRLKDKGFRFNSWTISERPKTPHIKLVIEAEMDVPDSPYDLDLLFGGEE